MNKRELSPAELGERLRIARANAGLTQDQAATSLDVARTTIVAIEAGSRKPRPAELAKLSELYSTTVNALLQRERVELDLVLQFRRSESTRREDTDVVTTTRVLQRLSEGYLSLEEMLSEPLAATYPATWTVKRARAREQADDAALELRARYGLGVGPIPDVISFLEEELKLRVFERPLPSKISGAFAFHSQVGGAMVLNSLHPRTRRAWTAAHECGHFLAHRDEIDVVYEEEIERARDRFADYFAGSFLMPAAGLRKRFDEAVFEHQKFSPRSLIALSRAYRVSVEAMARRLEFLELIPKGTYESLRRRGLNEGVVDEVMGPSISNDSPIPASQRMALLASEAFARGLLSEGQVTSIMQLDRVAVRRMLDALAVDGEEARP